MYCAVVSKPGVGFVNRLQSTLNCTLIDLMQCAVWIKFDWLRACRKESGNHWDIPSHYNPSDDYILYFQTKTCTRISDLSCSINVVKKKEEYLSLRRCAAEVLCSRVQVTHDVSVAYLVTFRHCKYNYVQTTARPNICRVPIV